MDGQEVKTKKNLRNARRVNCRVRNEKERRLTSYLSWKHVADNGHAVHKAVAKMPFTIERLLATERQLESARRAFLLSTLFFYPSPSASVNRTFFSRFLLCNLHHYLFFSPVRFNILVQRNSMNLPTKKNKSAIFLFLHLKVSGLDPFSHLAPHHLMSSVCVL